MDKVETKNGKILLIIVIVLLIALIGLVGFDAYNRMSTKGKNCDTTKQVEESKNEDDSKDDDISEEDVKTYKNNNYGLAEYKTIDHLINVFFNDDDRLRYLDTDEGKAYFALKSLVTSANYVIKDCSEFSNLNYGNMVCGFRAYDLNYEDIIDEDDNLIASDDIKSKLKSSKTNFISKEVFDNEMKRLYGDDLKYKYPDSINASYDCGVEYFFDKREQGYVKYDLASFGCGGIVGESFIVSDVKIKDNRMTFIIDTIVISDDSLVDTHEYYFDLDKNGNYIFAGVK